MLSVTSATVHQTMCTSAPKPHSSPVRLGRKEKLWNQYQSSSENRYGSITTNNDNQIAISSESTLNDVPKQLKNVSIKVVAASTSRTSERNVVSIPLSFNENVVSYIDEDNPIITSDLESEDHADTFNLEENNLRKKVILERKRKGGVQSRMNNAVKFLKISDSIASDSLSHSVQPDSIFNELNHDPSNDTSIPVQNDEITTWNNIKDVDEMDSDELLQTDNNISQEEPYYMTGFPNPPGENRCWLNATLQALFILPLIEYLDCLDKNECSLLTKTFVALQQFWKQGATEKSKIYQVIKKFKEELKILDETYPSQKQQDVSEFLMIFLNYIKTECKQLAMTKSSEKTSDEIENVPENGQVVNNISHIQIAQKKRLPLTAISPSKQNNNSNETMERRIDVSSPKKIDIELIETSKMNNPIDEFFLLHMLEHYTCKGCSQHRQKNIDNLMLYVDIPDKDTSAIDLTDAIIKTMEPEERNLTCAKCKHALHDVSTTFGSSPSVLIVQINRYGMTNEGIVEKINTAVNIPEELELNTNDGDINRFKPVSIIAHVGSAMDCGHYTSYVIHDDQWFHYNDMDVTPMLKNEALTAAQTTAYLVFFVNVKLFSKNSDTSNILESPLR